MKVYTAAYLGAFITFCLMDGIWLGVVATEFYFGALRDLLLEKPKSGWRTIGFTGLRNLRYDKHGNFKGLVADSVYR